ncbi:MAG: hypothetical protein ACD_62C00662G0005 [uncultured bacterium]|nr:MAG: hypothetical protein ACD_62C00662G0005 [uncultured bacterium]
MNLTFKELKTLFPHHTLTLADDVCVAGISRDTRNIKPGDIYVAIKGETHDGHDYVAVAFEKGAVAALVENVPVKRDNLIIVPHVIRALGELAAYYRRKFTQPLIAITGSNGKTTTKELLAHVLSQQGLVSATQGNLNNHIGVPFTIFSFDPKAHFLVVEMGMSHPGEIAWLTKIANPTVGLITSIGQAHLEGVGGTLEKVAQAKGELFDGLEPSATAIYFADDPLIAGLPTRAQKITFGFEPTRDVWASDITLQGNQTRFIVRQDGQETPITLNLVGKHHVQNALAVFTLARHGGLAPDSIQNGLNSFRMTLNRGKIISVGKIILIDDTYNANPDSMKAALKSIAEQYPHHVKVAVLGGMLELGKNAAKLHSQVGKFAKEIGVKELFVYGQNSPFYLRSYGYKKEEENEHFFRGHSDLARAVIMCLQNKSDQKTVVLFKGSRGMTMEKALEHVKVLLAK